MDYEKQAKDFCDKFNVKILVKFKKYGKHFVNDDQNRNIYTIKISKDSREYIFDFGDSVDNTEKMLQRFFKTPNKHYIDKMIIDDNPDLAMMMSYSRYKKHIKELSEYDKAGKDERPTAYSILACLNAYEPEGDIDEFAQNYGYTKPSEAIKVYNAVKKEYEALKMLFNDNELEALNEIN